jgi:hypothetical protein
MSNEEHEKRMSELNDRIEIANAQAAKYNAQAEKILKITMACGGLAVGLRWY